jgi:hypothetical protein
MSYARSAAFRVFQTRVEAARQVAKAASKIRFGGKKKGLYQESMFSSSILLTFANFETYIRDISNDICKGFCSAGLISSNLPEELRTQTSIVARLAEWSNIHDPGKLQANIWKHKAAGGFSVLSDTFTPKNIDVDALITKIAYPKIDNVVRLMRRLGVKDPRDALKAIGGHAIEQKLTSFHDARAELAHTGKLPTWTAQDYIDRLDDLGAFARTLDKIFCRHFCHYASLSNWIT